MDLNLLYLDNHLMVLEKPAGVLSQADETGDADMLSLGKAYLKKRFQKPGNVFLGLVQRLDRPVSGILVFARTSKAAARLTRQFRERRVRKGYLALVQGDPGVNGDWKDNLVKDGRWSRVVAQGHPRAKEAHLTWEKVAHEEGLSLVEITLLTGRRHQIRVQFASRGFPLLGDSRYGSGLPFDGRNLALHCHFLGLEHPVRRVPMSWRLEPPATWSNRFEAARRQLFRNPDSN